MYIVDVGKDLNTETETFVANYDGYCVTAYSFAPHTVRTSFNFMWLCLIKLQYVRLLRQICCGVPYQRSLRPLVRVTYVRVV